MLSFQRLSFKAFAAAGVIVLASCGGGDDDEAGGPVEFNAVPAEFGYTTPAGGGCVMGTAGDRFIINGGAAPYKVESTSPSVATLYTTDPAVRAETVTNIGRGGSVRIYFEGGCTAEEGTSILVTDALKRQFTVTITNISET